MLLLKYGALAVELIRVNQINCRYNYGYNQEAVVIICIVAVVDQTADLMTFIVDANG